MSNCTVEERILRKTVKDDQGCWVFQGCQVGGYGRVYYEGRVQPTHRVMYERVVGLVPEGLQLDHLCRNRACCNPVHLEPVTGSINVLRGDSPKLARQRLLGNRVAGDFQKAKTRCPAGHSYSGENLYISPSSGRGCRACRKVQRQAYYEKRRGPDAVL